MHQDPKGSMSHAVLGHPVYVFDGSVQSVSDHDVLHTQSSSVSSGGAGDGGSAVGGGIGGGVGGGVGGGGVDGGSGGGSGGGSATYRL